MTYTTKLELLSNCVSHYFNNFIALKYKSRETSLYFLVGLRSLFLTNILWIAQQAFMSSRVDNSLPIVPHTILKTFLSCL